MSTDPNTHVDISGRLRCAARHLQVVINMTEAGVPCPQVLHKSNAARAGLHMVGIKIVEFRPRGAKA